MNRRNRSQDDVIKWNHFPRYWPIVLEIPQSPVDSPHKSQWRRALVFSLICASTNGWTNTQDAGDLRRIHAHYYVTVMIWHAHLCSITLPCRYTWHNNVREWFCQYVLNKFRLCDVTCASWYLKSLLTRMFVQHSVQPKTKENTKLRITGPLWRECTGVESVSM